MSFSGDLSVKMRTIDVFDGSIIEGEPYIHYYGQKCLVFRIRKCYYDAIVSGNKTIEYRVDSPFWQKRLLKYCLPDLREDVVAVFLCGHRTHRRSVVLVERVPRPKGFSQQDQLDVPTRMCFAVHLGVERSKPQ